MLRSCCSTLAPDALQIQTQPLNVPNCNTRSQYVAAIQTFGRNWWNFKIHLSKATFGIDSEAFFISLVIWSGRFRALTGEWFSLYSTTVFVRHICFQFNSVLGSLQQWMSHRRDCLPSQLAPSSASIAPQIPTLQINAVMPLCTCKIHNLYLLRWLNYIKMIRISDEQ